MSTEINLKINADVQAAKQNIQDIKTETQSAVDGVGAFGITWGSVKGQFSKFKLIAVNGLKMIKAQAVLAGRGVKLMFGGSVTRGAKIFFNVVRAGIAATGIGLLVLAFVSLIAHFNQGEEGANRFKKVTAALGVFVDNVADVLGHFGELLYNIATLNYDGAVASFDKLQGAVSGFYEETSKEIKKSMDLQDLQMGLDRDMRKTTVAKAEAERKMMELRLKARDEENHTTAERIEFMQYAMELAEEQLKKDKEIAESKLMLKRMNNMLATSSKEDLDEEAALEVALLNIQTANFSARKRMAMELIALTNQEKSKRKAEKTAKENEARKIKAAADKEKALADKKADDKIKKDQKSADILRNMKLDNTLLAISDATDKAKAEIEIQRTKELESLESHANYLELKAEVDKKYDAKLKNVKKAEVEVIKTTEDMKLATVSNGLAAVQSLAGEHKALAVAQATIDGYGAVVGALNDKTVPSSTLRFINAAAMGVMAMANIKKIVSVKAGNGGGGGGSAPSIATGGSPAPQFSSGQFELKGGGAQQPVEAYVVTDSMTNSQDRLSSIRRRATI